MMVVILRVESSFGLIIESVLVLCVVVMVSGRVLLFNEMGRLLLVGLGGGLRVSGGRVGIREDNGIDYFGEICEPDFERLLTVFHIGYFVEFSDGQETGLFGEVSDEREQFDLLLDFAVFVFRGYIDRLDFSVGGEQLGQLLVGAVLRHVAHEQLESLGVVESGDAESLLLPVRILQLHRVLNAFVLAFVVLLNAVIGLLEGLELQKADLSRLLVLVSQNLPIVQTVVLHEKLLQVLLEPVLGDVARVHLHLDRHRRLLERHQRAPFARLHLAVHLCTLLAVHLWLLRLLLLLFLFLIYLLLFLSLVLFIYVSIRIRISVSVSILLLLLVEYIWLFLI